MKRHLLQSHEWEEYAKLEGHETFWRDGGGYEALAVKYETPMGSYFYCPYGPTVVDEEALGRALEALKNLAEDMGCFMVRVEPTLAVNEEVMRKLGCVKSHDLDPAHTWVLDLTASREEIMAGIEQRKLRHWRTHENKGIKLRKTQDPEQITILTQFLKGLGERDNFTPQDENHLKNQLKSGFATLYVAEVEKSDDAEGVAKGNVAGNSVDAAEMVPIAAALIYDYDGTRYYAHAATDDEHRKLMAGTIILIQMILDAQEEGGKVFDFWGVTTSEDPKHPWYGFTQYKKSFGGRQVDYAGTWDLPVKKMRYQMYKIVRWVNRKMRK